MASMATIGQRQAAYQPEHGDTVRLCKACGHGICTSVRGNTVRCPTCKVPNWIPKTGQATAEVIRMRTGSGPAAAPGVWDPAPVLLAELDDAGEDCPDCDAPLTETPGGTLHYCEMCETPVFPAALLPDADEQDPRRVPTRQERDLAAIALAQRKGVMMVQLDALADDDRIDPASLPIIEWFRDEVKVAATAGRLDELAALLPDAGITRRRWWQGRPAIDAPGYDLDEDDEGQDDEDEMPALGADVPAIAAPGVDHAAVVRANGFYDVDPAAPGGQCQIVSRRSGTTSAPYPTPQPCGGGAFRQFGPFRFCPGHHQQFTRSP